MRINILIGGSAGQGINRVSEIISDVLNHYGYFVFNYRDYPSLIRGGHNFNLLTVSDKRVGSSDSKIDYLIAMDENTVALHKKELNKDGNVIAFNDFEEKGRNLNVVLASALLKKLGVPKSDIENVVRIQLKNEDSVKAVSMGYNNSEKNGVLSKLKNKIKTISGSQAVALGAINSKLNLYIVYPMTPATGVMHELASKQNDNLMVFQGENEIGCASMAIGASFAGARVMTGTSGGGFDLMSESLSLQGMTEIPLTIYLASRPGPATGVPTYTAQADLDIALRAGHGDFPRCVVAPGNAKEAIEKTNEALLIAEKFKMLSIILSDKHLAESQYSFNTKVDRPLIIKTTRDLPTNKIVKASSYEVNSFGNSIEDAKTTKINSDLRAQKYKDMKSYIEKNFEMIKVYGEKNSKNLVIGWGSTKSAILDSIEGLDVKFLQILYAKPLSNKIKKEMQNAKNIILVENNQTGQMGRLLREKTGISISAKNRILKYDGRPFCCDVLKKEITRRLKK